MARRSRKGRDVTGIVVIDKPSGASSNQVLQQVKRLFNAKKAGHTGALDPLATGVLPICLGEATKVSAYLLESDKRYEVTCQLGIETDTGDSEGQIISQSSVPELDTATLTTTLDRFTGPQRQVPPMYSALKFQGQPLYKLARQGIDVDRKARNITIYDIQLLDLNKETFRLSVSCSKGTYIRTLIEDIGRALGCGGHVTALRRTQAAMYKIEQAHTLEVLQHAATTGQARLDACLISVEEALPDWPAIYVTEMQETALRHGQVISTQAQYKQEQVRLFSPNNTLIGLGRMTPQQKIYPKRIFAHNAVINAL